MEADGLAAVRGGAEALHQIADQAGRVGRGHDGRASAFGAAALAMELAEAGFDGGHEPAGRHLTGLALVEAEVARTWRGVGPSGETGAGLAGDLGFGGKLAHDARVGGVRFAPLAELLLAGAEVEERAGGDGSGGGGVSGDGAVGVAGGGEVTIDDFAVDGGFKLEGRVGLGEEGEGEEEDRARSVGLPAYTAGQRSAFGGLSLRGQV
jgi:hypothetical protein